MNEDERVTMTIERTKKVKECIPLEWALGVDALGRVALKVRNTACMNRRFEVVLCIDSSGRICFNGYTRPEHERMRLPGRRVANFLTDLGIENDGQYPVLYEWGAKERLSNTGEAVNPSTEA